jgi:hypothetical protein
LAAELSNGHSNKAGEIKQLFSKTASLNTESTYSMTKKILSAALIAVAFFSSCKKETETLNTVPVSEYIPLAVGKYITYQLDSFRYKPFSLEGITISFQAKYIVDGEVTDNNGKPAFRIVRQLRRNPTDAWVNDNSFMAIVYGNNFEFVENNLRFIKMRGLVKDGLSWKGNSYINTSSQFSDYLYMSDWDYTFDSTGAPLTLGAFNLDNTVKVSQRDEEVGLSPEIDPSTLFYERNYGVEYYAKGIGLVYRKFLHTRYQGNSGNPYYEPDSKGITMVMIDHN